MAYRGLPQGGEDIAERDDSNATVLPELPHGLFARRDQVEAARNGAFEDSVVGIVGQDFQPPTSLHDPGEAREVNCHPGRFLPVACELARRNFEQLADQWG